MPVTALKGVGPGLSAKLAAIGIFTVQDLLFHLPLRYQDRTRLTPIGATRPGADVMLEGEVIACDIQFGRRRSLLCRLKDASGIITLRFFHFSAAQKNALQAGARLRCYGEVRLGKTGFEIYHPEYQFLDERAPAQIADCLTPIYPATEGLQQVRLRALLEHHVISPVRWYDDAQALAAAGATAPVASARTTGPGATRARLPAPPR